MSYSRNAMTFQHSGFVKTDDETYPCLFSNVSRSGATLTFDGPIDLPDGFSIQFPARESFQGLRCAMARWNSNRRQLRALAALVVATSTVSNWEAAGFDCTVTLTRVLVRDGQDWKEIDSGTIKHTLFRELNPQEKRNGKTWGFFLTDES